MEQEIKIRNYGFKNPVITPDQYVLGGNELPDIVLREDGQYNDYLPLYEPQAEKYESWGCTVWGSQNAIEILHKFLFNVEPNYSERYNYILAGINEGGGDPHISIETMRLQGLINQELLPIPDTYEEFKKPNPMEEKYLAEGRKFLTEYEIKHKWVLQGKETKEDRIKTLKENLKYSPIGVSVSAWTQSEDIYIDGGLPNNHWCVCYGWTDKGWKIFDSYDHSKKIYSFDSEILFAKRVLLKKKDFYPAVAKQTNWVSDLIISFFRFLKAIIKK